MWRITDVSSSTQTRSQKRHQQSSRDTFAGNVRDHQSDLIIINLYPVVVVSRHFLSGKVVGADVVSFELRISSRQEFQLHLARDFQLTFETLLLNQLLMKHDFLDDDGHL